MNTVADSKRDSLCLQIFIFLCGSVLLAIEIEYTIYKLLALEIDYLRRLARVSRLQKVPNTAIRSKMQAEQLILVRIQRRQLEWYGHLLRMEDNQSLAK